MIQHATAPSALTLWAKTPRTDDEIKRYGRDTIHPLLYHLLDVAAVAETLWDGVLPPAAKREIARGLGLDEADARQWVVFLAGAHDIGKASPVFQYCAKSPVVLGRLKQAGFLPLNGDHGTKHGTISTLILSELLPNKEYRWEATDAQTMAVAIGGHHGVFPQSGQWDGREAKADRGKGEAWQAAQRELLATLARGLDGPPMPVPTVVTTPMAMTVAGLVSVADWIGSDERNNFPYANADAYPDAGAYWRHTQSQATAAIDRLFWRIPEGDTAPRDFTAIFPKITAPNPTQEAAIALAKQLAAANAPSLTIIESPMGEGKTEAALYLAEHLGHALGTPGVYVALPTQATSNQMFGRVVDYLGGRFPDAGERVNVQLLHGHADLSALFTLLKKAAAGENMPPDVDTQGVEIDNEHANGSVVAAEWFTYRKRGLLAPFGVGTVDQALLAVLQTRHVFVRLFGLAHKCVIIDEVHAYDTYMTTLLARLLTWLGALGCPVVLLSATLPNRRREELLRAYADGTGAPIAEDAVFPTAPYPRLSWVAGGVAGATAITGVSPRSTKRVRPEWVDGAVPDVIGGDFALGALLRDQLRDGGCAAVICNTVARAQAVYTALKPFFPDLASDGAPTLDLLHSRYRFLERDDREKRALLRFGKPDATVDVEENGKTVPHTVHRPDRAVLVATQIIEQSLDLDFDLMITDIAPADLVLQRLGRLHRHERANRPTPLHDCTLYICQPVEVSPAGVPKFEQHFDLIYDGHVLLRSWLTLRDRMGLYVPGDVEGIIENVYGAKECPAIYPDTIRKEWEVTQQELQSDNDEDTEKAAQRYLRSPHFSGGLWNLVPALAMEEDAPEFHQRFQALTRLTDDSISAVMLHPPEYEELVRGGNPPPNRTRRLLRRAITVSNRRAVALVRELGEHPAGWATSSLLRHHLLVRLDDRGQYGGGSSQLFYDGETGLHLRKGSEVMP